MDTGNMMSSLREMIDAAIDAKLAATHDQAETARLQYSRHETIVRESLQRIGEHLPPGGLGPRRLPTSEEIRAGMEHAMANMKCYDCGQPIKVGEGHECEQMKARLNPPPSEGTQP